MGNSKPSALLSLIGVMLLWPYVLTKSGSPRLQTEDSSTLTAVQGEERPHVVKRSIQKCESAFDKYCLNNGLCILLVDINEHHCKCDDGFYGPRCGNLELVFQPMAQEQILLTVFCVILLMIGLAGALYFCCKCAKVQEKQIFTSSKAAGLQRSQV